MNGVPFRELPNRTVFRGRDIWGWAGYYVRDGDYAVALSELYPLRRYGSREHANPEWHVYPFDSYGLGKLPPKRSLWERLKSWWVWRNYEKNYGEYEDG